MATYQEFLKLKDAKIIAIFTDEMNNSMTRVFYNVKDFMLITQFIIDAHHRLPEVIINVNKKRLSDEVAKKIMRFISAIYKFNYDCYYIDDDNPRKYFNGRKILDVNTRHLREIKVKNTNIIKYK